MGQGQHAAFFLYILPISLSINEIDDLIDYETWGRDNMPPAEWAAAGGLKAFCKQQGEK